MISVYVGASKQSTGLRTPGRSRCSSMRGVGNSGRMGPGTQESARSGATSAGGSVASAAAVQESVAAAVRQMQQNLPEDLHDEKFRVKGLLGKGGFGTVYRGALSFFFSLFDNRVCYLDSYDTDIKEGIDEYCTPFNYITVFAMGLEVSAWSTHSPPRY